MINEKLQESLDVLEKDAAFIKRIRKTIQDAENPDLSQEERLEVIKKAHTWVLHILDFFVTIDMIDMDADLLRLSEEDPQTASRFRDSLNDTALSLKQNYQYLCKEGTIYGPEGLPGFKLYYTLALLTYLKGQESGKKIALPNYIVSYSEIEFFKVGANRAILEKKLKHLSQVDFSITSIKQFIDNCFLWSDKISEYQTRMRANKSSHEINRQTLNGIHEECNGVVYYNTSADKFARAMMNKEKPSFHLMNKDRFYAVLHALHLKMGALSNKDQWLNAVLNSFSIRKSDYMSTVKRIKDKKTKKLNDFYESIISIIDSYGI